MTMDRHTWNEMFDHIDGAMGDKSGLIDSGIITSRDLVEMFNYFTDDEYWAWIRTRLLTSH